MKYTIGDTIVYGGNGVCEVSGIENKNLFGDGEEQYYVLTPLFIKQASTLYVPVNNEKMTSKIKPVISHKEADELVKNIPNIEIDWIEDKNLRKNTFSHLINFGTREEIIGIINLIIKHRDALVSEGKRLNMMDEKLLNDAERVMNGEFAVAFGILPNEVPEYIHTVIAKGA
ncbi:MAG: hypothetical protein MJ172_08250 [Clostridia bacterium]|nr:hypothetical protein [Clostridia bacterium]